MLSWYRESPTWLAATVSSLTKAGVSHVVAVDGAYQLFPGANGEPASGAEQADAIVQTAHGAGIGCTIHRPNRPWSGGEVAKRSFMFATALLEAETGDWLLWVDADEVIHRAPHDLLVRLATSDMDVAAVSLWQRHDAHETAELSEQARTLAFTDWTGRDHRVLYRALPGLRCELRHDHVTDGTSVLRGGPNMAAAEDCHDVIVEHRHEFRDRARMNAAAEYYRLRDVFGVERETVGEAFSRGLAESADAVEASAAKLATIAQNYRGDDA